MKNSTLTLLILLNVAVLPKLFSQNVGINSTGSAPDASAMLDVSSTSKGFLLPRMTTGQRDAITLPATGLSIFNTTLVSYQVNIGTPASPNWTSLATSQTINNVWSLGGNSVASAQTIGTTTNFDFPFITDNTEKMRLTAAGDLGIGITSPTAVLHLKAGTTSANTAPLKFTSGSLMTTAQAGAVEFLTDKFYGTVTTSAARKEFTLNDASLTSGRIPVVTTNGRLTDNANFVWDNTWSRLGIKQSSPTAYLQLGGGTATANTAPLKFTAGTLLTTPETGAIEYNATHFYATIGATRYQLDQQESLLSATAPVTYSSGLIGITQATTSTDGYLSSTDWNIFNNKANTANTWNLGGNSVASAQNIGTTTNFDFPFITNNTEKMRLSAGGNLGIGATVTDGTNAEKLLVNAGTTSYNVISGKGDLNSYLQLNIKNINSGTAASSDIVATNDAGTEANGLNYVDLGVNSSGNTSTGVLGGANTGYLYSTGSDFSIGNATASKNLLLFTGGIASSNERMRIDGNGNVGVGTTSPTAILHLKAGTTSANTAPLKFTSGSLMTTAEAGGVEFLTDKFYGTITTGAARKEFALNDIGLTSGRIPFSTTNGRLTDLATFTYATNRLSPTYVTLGAGTATAGTAPLVFTSGTNLTTPLAGAMEFDGTHFYGTVGSTRYQLDQQSATTWNTTGNAGIIPYTHFLGTTDNKSLRFRSNNLQRMIIDSTGNVGIGTSGFDATVPEKLLVDAGTNTVNGAYTALTPINAIGFTNGYQQIQVQNRAWGKYSSSDFVAASDGTQNGTVPYNTDIHYVDLGINSSGYDNNNSNILNQPYTSYLYAASPQHFYIGNGYSGKDVIFFTNYGPTNAGSTADGFELMRLKGGTSAATQQVTIATPTPNGTNRLTVNGSISASAFNVSSDRRLKTNIKSLSYGLKEVVALQPVSYNWKETPSSDEQLGLIAQDAKNIIPEAVSGNEETGTLSINYTEIIPVLINAIKEQQKEIDTLKKDIQLLKDKK